MSDQKLPGGESGADGVGVDYPKIEAMVGQLADAITKSKSSSSDRSDGTATLRLDYQLTVETFKLLSDIRFRCLVFVTAFITLANALLPLTGNLGARIGLGFVGFLTTLGITIYELRNSQLYEAAIHRAKILETDLCMVRAAEQTKKEGPFGLFNERPLYVEGNFWKDLGPEERETQAANPPFMSFWFVDVKHDRGLGLIYGAVLGGWAYLIVEGILSLPPPARLWSSAPYPWIPTVSALLIALVTFLISTSWFIFHDDTRFRQTKPGVAGRSPQSDKKGFRYRLNRLCCPRNRASTSGKPHN